MPTADSPTPPRVCAILLSYNCEGLVADAVGGLLQQDYAGPMAIAASDDASTDRTFDRLRDELARAGPDRPVQLFRRAANSGSKSAHFNDVLPKADGDILVSFDSDDVAEPSRIRRLVETFAASPHVYAVYSGFSQMDSAGRPLGGGFVPHPATHIGTARWFAKVDAYAAGATLAFRRSVAERFGPLAPDINEDVVIPFRASLLGECAYIDEPLVRVRRHAGSLTADHGRLVSLDAYRARMLLGIERARRSLQSRLADLRRAEEMMPGRLADFAELRLIAEESLRHAEWTAGLADSRLTARVAALARLLRARAYPDETMQNLALAVAPRAYLAYKRRALGITD